MRQETFTLPSGCQIKFRQITLAEENILISAAKSKKAATQQTVIDDVLSACAMEVVDPGPYNFLTIGGKPAWPRMLAGDRFVSLLQLRILSYKQREMYTVPGVRCPACNHRWDYQINLLEDLYYREASEEDLEHLRTNEPFAVTIADKVVTFGHATCDLETKVSKLEEQNPGRSMASLMRARILDVDGIERRDILDWLDGNNGQSKDFSGLTSEEADELREAFDEHNCGVDTEVEADCPSCGESFQFILPFDSGFLLPGQKIRERRKQRRRGMGSSG